MRYELNVNTQDNKSNTALMYYVREGSGRFSYQNLEAILALLEGGADPNIKNKAGETPTQLVQKNCRNEIAKEANLKLLKKHGAKE